MGKITDIKKQEKDPNRVSIFVDGEFAFGLSVETRFVKKLEISQDLTQSKINELIKTDQVERLVNKAFKLLSYRPRSEKEVRDHLLRKGKLKNIEKSEPEKEQYEKSVEKAIERLKANKHIDDKEFVSWFVDQRNKFKPKGQRLLKLELSQKGVDKETIEELLDKKVPEEASSEKSLAMKVATKQYYKYKNLTPRDFKIKMGQFLSRKGFDWETVKNVVDTLGTKDVK